MPSLFSRGLSRPFSGHGPAPWTTIQPLTKLLTSTQTLASQLRASIVPGMTISSSFQAGSGGLLETGNGQNFGLGGGGLKQEIVQQVCNQVLAHAKSLL